MTDTLFTVPQGSFELRRTQFSASSPLRAWDAADELVLNEILDQQLTDVLLLNDSHGALAVALADHSPVSISDSLVAQRAAAANLAHNNRSGVTQLSSVDPLPDRARLVIIKIPRTLSLLEHQLHQLRPLCTPGTRIIGAGMTKHIHTSTLQLFEQLLGATTTSLAKKKARLIHTTYDPGLSPGPDPWPKTVSLDIGLDIVAYPGVFAGTKVDIGARALLDELPSGQGPVVDLGSGNGIIGTALAMRTGEEVTFVDESYLAVTSARATFERNNPHAAAHFLVDDAGSSLEAESFKLVLNNPPFHDNNALTDATAWRMFNQAQRVLVPGGELRVVANRHLGYHAKLKRLFDNCETVSSTRKFVVLSSVKG